MADKKKSQAQKAASSAKSKNAKNGKSSGKKPDAQKVSAGKNQTVPARVISSIVSICLFVLFLVTALWPNGALIKVIRNVFFGLFGEACFYIAIPALLYLFIIHAFSGKRPVTMRTICLISFVLICGCIAHLTYKYTDTAKGIDLVSNLYFAGVNGESGGVICGLLGMLIFWLCDTYISYILLVIAGILTLLASMQITIPSIIRAIQNRPRADWEEEEAREPKPEPAELVVNHIANKRIEIKENQRQKQAAKAAAADDRASDIMRQINSDVDTPVSAAAHPFVPHSQEEEIQTAVSPVVPEPIHSPVPAEEAVVK